MKAFLTPLLGLLLSLGLFQSALAQIPETEPNNSFATANTPAYTNITTGSVGCAGDNDDYFRVVLPAGTKSLRLITKTQATSGSGAVYYYLYNKFGGFLTNHYVSYSTTQFIDTLEYPCFEGDTFFVRAQFWTGSCASYEFSTTLPGYFLAGADPESNDGFTAATPLPFNFDTSGHLYNQKYAAGGAADDNDDYYRVIAPTGNRGIRIATRWRMATLGASGAVYYYLYNKYQNFLANRYVSFGNAWVADTLDYPCNEGDTFYVRMQHWAGSCKEYRVRVGTTGLTTVAGDVESNDGFAQATPVAMNADSSGHLNNQRYGAGAAYIDDNDYYRVIASVGNRGLRLTSRWRATDGGTSSAVYVYLYNKYQNFLTNHYVSFGTTWVNDTLEYSCIEGDTFYVRMQHWSGGCKEYTFRPASPNYFTAGSDPESNDGFATATPYNTFNFDTSGHLYNQKYTAGGAMDDNDDYYRVAAPAGNRGIRIATQWRMSMPGATGAVYYYLYNKFGAFLTNRYVSFGNTWVRDTLDYPCIEGDTFFVRMQHWAGSCKEYRFRIGSTSLTTVPLDAEVNDAITTPTPIPFGVDTAGHLYNLRYNATASYYDNDDYYRVIAPPGNRGITIPSRWRTTDGGTSSSVYVQLYNKYGNFLTNHYIVFGNTWTYDTLDYRCFEGDTFYVRMQHWSGGCKEYRFSAGTPGLTTVASDVEVNDAFTQATPIPFNTDSSGHLYNLRYSAGGAYFDNDDYYRIVAPPTNSSIRVTSKWRTTDGGNSSSVYVQLYNKYGNFLTNHYITFGTSWVYDTLDYSCFQGDTVYVRMQQWSGGCKEYTYRVGSTGFFIAGNDAESNDNIATATPLPPAFDTSGHLGNMKYQGSNAVTDDDDYYRVVPLPGAKGIRVITQWRAVIPGASGSVYLYLYNKAGGFITNRYLTFGNTFQRDTLDWPCFENDTFYVRMQRWSGSCMEYRFRVANTHGFITGNPAPCAGSAQTYSIPYVVGATSYTWILPAGWTGSSTTNSITVTVGGTTPDTIRVTINHPCGTSSQSKLAVSPINSTGAPGAITGPTAVCSGSSVTYSIAAVAGATSYAWTAPAGWTGSSTTNSITLTAAASSGNISVTASSGCGTSAASTLAVTSSTGTASPGAITGAAAPCVGTTGTYSVATVPGALSYTWTLPSGWSGTSTTNSISATVGTASGNITVSTTNGCGAGTPATLAVAPISTPATPGTISGPAVICNGAAATYSVTPVSTATSYTWTVPTGWTGSSTTSSLTTTPAATSGNITVTATNACGTSAAATLAVTSTSPPAAPGTITGATAPCSGTTQTYSVPSATGVTYNWTLPTGWTGSSTTNSISATVGAGSGNVSVTASNSCGASAASTLAVAPIAAPSQPGTMSGLAAPCVGTTQTYSVPSATNVTTYNWTLPTGWTGTSTTSSITVTVGSGSGNISVTGTNTCGTSTARTLAVAPVSTPAQPASITGPAAPCASTATVYSVGAVTGATSYTWTLPASWTGASTTNSITATPVGASGGTISVVATNACGSSTAQALTVGIAQPAAQPGTITMPTNLCSGVAGSYSVPSATGVTSYTWAFPAGWTTTGGTNTAAVIASPGTSGTISVTALNACGASAPRTASVTVISAPGTLSPISGPATLCAGTVASYTATNYPGSTYTWTVPAGWNGSATGNVLTATSSAAGGAGNITVAAQNVCGTSPVASFAVSVTPSTPTAVSITSSTGSSSVCAGVPVTFTATVTGGGTTPQFVWTRNNSVQVGLNSPAFTVSNPVSGEVISLTMASNAACPLPATAAAVPIILTVLPPVVPGININSLFGTAPIVCAGTTLNFVANIAGGGSNPQYQWYRNTTPVGTNSPTFSASNWTNGEVVTARLTSNAQCATPVQQTSNPFVVNVSPAVTPTVSVSANPANVFTPGMPVTFTASAAGAGPSPQYQWYRNGQIILGGIGPVYTTTSLTGSDTITVRLTSSDPCAVNAVAFSTPIVVPPPTAVETVAGRQGVSLFPNPNRGQFTVAIAGGVAGVRAVMEVLNALGQRVYFREFITEKRDWKVPVEMRDVASGVYLLRVSSEAGKVSTIRFRVED